MARRKTRRTTTIQPEQNVEVEVVEIDDGSSEERLDKWAVYRNPGPGIYTGELTKQPLCSRGEASFPPEKHEAALSAGLQFVRWANEHTRPRVGPEPTPEPPPIDPKTRWAVYSFPGPGVCECELTKKPLCRGQEISVSPEQRSVAKKAGLKFVRWAMVNGSHR